MAEVSIPQKEVDAAADKLLKDPKMVEIVKQYAAHRMIKANIRLRCIEIVFTSGSALDKSDQKKLEEKSEAMYNFVMGIRKQS